ncbi:MAG: DUF4271 domain-containing protein [Gilvibacter sp.]
MQELPFDLREIASNDWLIFVCVGCFLLLAIAKRLFPERSLEFSQLPVSNKYFLAKGRNAELNHPFTILLWFASVVNLSLFIGLLLVPSQRDPLSLEIMGFVQILAVVFGFILVKVLLEKLIGIVFDIEPLINQYIFEKISYINLLSVFLFAANVIYIWGYHDTKIVLWIVFAGAAATILLSLLYSYKTNEKLIFSNFFYFILYLCALEISPYLLAYKAFLTG